MAYKLDPVVQWLRKFGSFDWENKHHLICQSHPNKDYGLEAKVKATGETEVILGTTSLCS
jgi:hypothetical protein